MRAYGVSLPDPKFFLTTLSRYAGTRQRAASFEATLGMSVPGTVEIRTGEQNVAGTFTWSLVKFQTSPQDEQKNCPSAVSPNYHLFWGEGMQPQTKMFNPRSTSGDSGVILHHAVAKGWRPPEWLRLWRHLELKDNDPAFDHPHCIKEK